MVNTQQRIAKLEGLLERVRERRQLPRTTSADMRQALEFGTARSPAELDEYDDVVDLDDDEIIELGDSVPPPEAEPTSVHAAPERSSLVAPPQAEQLPEPREPEPSQPPPRAETLTNWPSSVPPPQRVPPDVDAAPPEATRLGLDFDDIDEEEPPVSSRRPIASSMDEALADAAAREVPLKTPPPESGPQEAMPTSRRSLSPPLVDDSLPGDAEANVLAEGLPTSAQLGNTISLDEGGPVDFDVRTPSEPVQLESAPPPSEDFEIRLPKREAGGSYDADLAPPPEAKGELDAHRERALRAAEQSSAPSTPFVARPASEVNDMESIERPVVLQAEVTQVTDAPQRFRPGSFLELLDASLKLGQD